MAQKKPTPPPTYTPAPTAAPPATASPMPSPTPTPKVIQPEFEELRAEYGNDDIVGYLRIAGASIDYPVTHSGDNSYYLHYDIRKNASNAGWIFMDYENDVERDDPNTVIYGHNMRQDIMFHSLRYYQSWDYFNNHRYIEFNTIYENHVWEVFSFYRTDTDFPYIQVIFPSDEDFFSLATQMKALSMYDTGVDIKPGDRILTLSTCTNEDEDTRFALSARRLSPDEIPPELKSN
jgi:sortase B